MIKTRHIAQVCREAMSALSGTPHWGELSDRQRRSAMAIVNFLLANPETSSLAVHNAWMGEMIHMEGWQYGDIYDADAKRHPNLVAYEVLPRHVQDSYVISIGIVRGMLDIGDRYESCAPAQAARDVAAPSPVTPVVMSAPDGDNDVSELTPPTQADETSANEGGVHFTAHTTLTESSPESGDMPPETDPATMSAPDGDNDVSELTPPTQVDETSIKEGGVHFTGHNMLTESSPESGDTPPETDPAAAE